MKRKTLINAVVVAVLCLLPTVLSNFSLFQVTQVVIYAIALLGLNMVTGYGGQISIGHGAFFALGGYGTALLLERAHLPYGWAVPLCGVGCFLAGFLFGLPALRLQGLHLALATLALAVAVPQTLKYFDHWSGGSQGLVLDKPEPPFGLPLSADQWIYGLVLGTALLLFWLARNLLRGRFGRAIVATRDNPLAASAMGINLAWVKSLTFGLSAAYTGIAGALSALAVAYVAPDSFNLMLSIYMLVGVVVGGLSSISGAVWGALFVFFVPTLAQQISKAAPSVVFGIAMFVVIYAMPGGIAGGINQWSKTAMAWWHSRRARV
jgi:branched-chain amino acid transport system permease protein